MAAEVNSSSGSGQLLPGIARIVAGFAGHADYSQDAALNAKIAAVGRKILEQLPAHYQAAYQAELAAATQIKLPNYVTREQLDKLKEVYPLLKAENIHFQPEIPVSDLEQETEACQFDQCPPLYVALKSGKTHTIMATTLTHVLAGWAVEDIDWRRGKYGEVLPRVAFPVEDIRSVRRLAPDFETWAKLQLPPVNDEGKTKA